MSKATNTEPKPAVRGPKSEPFGKGDTLVKFDKYMVTVHRETRRVKDGDTGVTKQMGVTVGVTIGRFLRANIKINEKIAMEQNTAQDHQNETATGVPEVQWLFPAGVVHSGEYYAAHDQLAGTDSSATKMMGAHKEPAKYLVIDLDKPQSNKPMM